MRNIPSSGMLQSKIRFAKTDPSFTEVFKTCHIGRNLQQSCIVYGSLASCQSSHRVTLRTSLSKSGNSLQKPRNSTNTKTVAEGPVELRVTVYSFIKNVLCYWAQWHRHIASCRRCSFSLSELNAGSARAQLSLQSSGALPACTKGKQREFPLPSPRIGPQGA